TWLSTYSGRRHLSTPDPISPRLFTDMKGEAQSSTSQKHAIAGFNTGFKYNQEIPGHLAPRHLRVLRYFDSLTFLPHFPGTSINKGDVKIFHVESLVNTPRGKWFVSPLPSSFAEDVLTRDCHFVNVTALYFSSTNQSNPTCTRRIPWLDS
ncbi:745_t:CDS:1, partial [Acaulospora colombiana]